MKRSLFLALITAVISFVFYLYSPLFTSTNNVCKTFEDYYTNRDNNKNCYYNPDLELEVPDIIKRHGYSLETHHVTTKDGYILTVFRIPYGRKSKSKPGKPVFLQHGLSINSGAFVNIGRKSLGFVLADAGYDVWLGNFRGSKYSQNHTNLDNTESKFWDFGLHEHGTYDLSAQLDLVYQATKQKIVYIGFSMGATVEYIYTSTYPDISDNVLQATVSLVPSVYTRNLAYTKNLRYIWHYLKGPIQSLTNGRIYPRVFMPMMLFRYLCFPLPIQMKICQLPDMYLLGFNYDQNDPETLPIVMQYNLDATSVKTMSHYSQMSQSGNFEQYDYGADENKNIYGSPEPPRYELSKIKVPHYLLYALNDRAATKENMELLYNSLPENAKSHGIHVVTDENFSHYDVITGKDSKAIVYDRIINFLNSLKY